MLHESIEFAATEFAPMHPRVSRRVALVPSAALAGTGRPVKPGSGLSCFRVARGGFVVVDAAADGGGAGVEVGGDVAHAVAVVAVGVRGGVVVVGLLRSSWSGGL